MPDWPYEPPRGIVVDPAMLDTSGFVDAYAVGYAAIREQQRQIVLDAYEIPQELRDAWREIKEA